MKLKTVKILEGFFKILLIISSATFCVSLAATFCSSICGTQKTEYLLIFLGSLLISKISMFLGKVFEYIRLEYFQEEEVYESKIIYFP